MLTDRKDSSENYNKNNKKLIERYIGEGVLISEDGTKLSCKFEAGQLEDGLNFLVCDFSIFDLNSKEYFPNSNFENYSLHDIKNRIGWNLWATQYKLFHQFKSFEGVTSDGFDDFEITVKLGDYFSIYDDSLRDNTQQVKVAYYATEVSVNENTEENLQFRLSQNSSGLYIWVINIGIFIFFKDIYYIKSILLKKINFSVSHVQKVRSKVAIFTSIESGRVCF